MTNDSCTSTDNTATGTAHTIPAPAVPVAAVEEEDVKKQHKNLLMTLFNKTGAAKLPAVLRHLGLFLDDKASGKVCNPLTR